MKDILTVLLFFLWLFGTIACFILEVIIVMKYLDEKPFKDFLKTLIYMIIISSSDFIIFVGIIIGSFQSKIFLQIITLLMNIIFITLIFKSLYKNIKTKISV